MLFFCPECKMQMGWMDKNTAFRMVKQVPQMKSRLMKIYTSENADIHRPSDLIRLHCGRGPFFRCPKCRQIVPLTTMLYMTSGILNQDFYRFSSHSLLQKLYETRKKYEKWAGYEVEERNRRTNLLASISRLCFGMKEKDIREVQEGEKWSCFDVINNLIAEEEWSMENNVRFSDRDRIRAWEEALNKLKRMHSKTLRSHHVHH